MNSFENTKKGIVKDLNFNKFLSNILKEEEMTYNLTIGGIIKGIEEYFFDILKYANYDDEEIQVECNNLLKNIGEILIQYSKK
jgi:hypothetical protein